MSGFGGYKTYMRDTPDRFETEADDTLMKSMYKTYATEGEDKHGLPTGHFWVTWSPFPQPWLFLSLQPTKELRVGESILLFPDPSV